MVTLGNSQRSYGKFHIGECQGRKKQSFFSDDITVGENVIIPSVSLVHCMLSTSIFCNIVVCLQVLCCTCLTVVLCPCCIYHLTAMHLLYCSFVFFGFLFCPHAYIILLCCSSLTTLMQFMRHHIALPANRTLTSPTPLCHRPALCLPTHPFRVCSCLSAVWRHRTKSRPCSFHYLLFCKALNIRFVLHLRSAALSDLTDAHKPDLFCLTKAWIKPTTTSTKLLSCTPPSVFYLAFFTVTVTAAAATSCLAMALASLSVNPSHSYQPLL